MIKSVTMAVVLLCMTAVSGCLGSPEAQSIISKVCMTGQTTYSFILVAHTKDRVKDRDKQVADGLYAELKGICDKGPNVTGADIVLAGFNVDEIIKVWRKSS